MSVSNAPRCGATVPADRAYTKLFYVEREVGEVTRLEANPFTSAADSTPSTASVLAHALSVNIGALMQF